MLVRPRFVSLVAALVAIAAVGALAQHPPPLPFDFWQAFTVRTSTVLTKNGTSTEEWSVGFHVVLSTSQGVRCRHTIDDLYPTIQNYTTTNVANFTGGIRTSRTLWNSGDVTNCTSETINGTMPAGGAYYLTPPAEIFATMVLVSYAIANDLNCSVFQWLGTDQDGNRQMLQWFVAVDSDVPQVLVNQTFYSPPLDNGTVASRILTTAYNGYEAIDNWPLECVAPNICGNQFCAANAAAGDAAIESGISWVCSNVLDCTNISQGGPNFYPNTDLAHGTWAFNTYYQQFISQGPGSCNFGGAGVLTVCSGECTLCNASARASNASLVAAIAWVCTDASMDCSMIQPGGANYLPNTPQAHADVVFDIYYQAYRCVPEPDGVPWCDFNGTATVVPC